MITFLILAGMLAWGVVTLLLLLAAVVGLGSSDDGFEWSMTGILWLLAICSLAGFITVTVDNGWLDSTPPADGCYQVYSQSDALPITAGNTVVVTTYDDVSWVPISCPAR